MRIYTLLERICTKLSIIADYPIEIGTSGIWTYRKWASGMAECWTTETQTVTGTSAANLMGGYYSYKMGVGLPFAFKIVSLINVNARLGTGVGAGYGTQSNNNAVNIYCVSNQNSNSITYGCRVVGIWK